MVWMGLLYIFMRYCDVRDTKMQSKQDIDFVTSMQHKEK